ncbi:2058_t:CDS:1, partial [Funneliformis caledonium]
SNLSGILDITSNIKIHFKQHFDRLMKARNYTFDEMCFSVVINICSLRGNIKTSTVKNFYNGVSGSK